MLQAMQAYDASGTLVPDLCVTTVIGTTYDVEWVTVPDRDPDGISVFIRRQFNDRTA